MRDSVLWSRWELVESLLNVLDSHRAPEVVRALQGRASALIASSGVGATSEQHAQHRHSAARHISSARRGCYCLCGSASHGEVQRRPPLAAVIKLVMPLQVRRLRPSPAVHERSRLKKRRCGARMPPRRAPTQRGETPTVASVGVTSAANQPAHTVIATAPRRMEEC